MFPKAKPFLKWAGGKARLAATLSEILPNPIGTYFEVFVGGGALFWHLAEQKRFQRAVLNDCNPELINCYRVVRDNPAALARHLETLELTKDFFTALRAVDPSTLAPVARAGRTLYLNRTCFNGLFRLNKKGQFNVPWGNYPNPRLVDETNLTACAAILNRDVTLLEEDFSIAVATAKPGDAVYFDPPYIPLNATSNFRSYTKDGFTLADQERLARCVHDLARRGVAVVVSNSDTPVARELYANFNISVVKMRRNINSNGDARGPIDELIIVTEPGEVPHEVVLSRSKP